MLDPHPGEGGKLKLRLVVAVTVMGAAFACSGAQNDAEVSLSPVTSASAAPSASTAATPTASGVATEKLPEGRSFGYIKSVDKSQHTLVFDLAEFHTGADADKAAQEDGVIKPGEHVDNDYYIRNKNTKLRTLAYAPDASVTVIDQAHCCDPKPSTMDAFTPSQSSGYWVTTTGGVIVKIEEQFVP